MPRMMIPYHRLLGHIGEGLITPHEELLTGQRMVLWKRGVRRGNIHVLLHPIMRPALDPSLQTD